MTFTFQGPLIQKMSHFFHITNLKITFRSTNTIRKTLRTRADNSVTKHLNGIYRMKEQICKL